jgi:hypothetical protein
MRLTVLMSVLASLFVLASSTIGSADPDVTVAGNGADAGGDTVGNTVLAQYGGRGRIYVISASYGRNCGVPRGNVTAHVAGTCNGQRVCPYTVHHRIIGDPAPGCPKDFVVRWQCGDGEPRSAGAPPEAGFGTVVVLSCRGREY